MEEPVEVESPLSDVPADMVEHGSAEIPVYSFTNFAELKAAVEADPPKHDALGLYAFVQSRLQRPDSFATATPEEIDKIWQAGQQPGAYTSPNYTREELDRQVAAAKAEHAWLREALVKLEERAFGPIKRGQPRELPKLSIETHAAILRELTENDFEAGWHDRMGGDITQDARLVLGTALGLLVVKYHVHPRALADYVRESLRLEYGKLFDAP